MGKFYVPIRRTVYTTIGTINRLIPASKTGILILCYHGIGNDSWTFSVSKETFEKQMKHLKKDGYSFIMMRDVLQYLDGKKEISKPSVVVQFDDGYKDILAVKSFLKKQNIQPTLFLLSDTKKANRKELANNRPFLNKKEILSLVKDGWEIGSHTATHSFMNTLSKKQIVEEVTNSKKKLEKYLGLPIDYIAYPKGKYNKAIIKEVKKTGYKLGLSMDDGTIDRDVDRFIIPRIGVDRTHTFAEYKTLYVPFVIALRGYIKRHSIIKV